MLIDQKPQIYEFWPSLERYRRLALGIIADLALLYFIKSSKCNEYRSRIARLTDIDEWWGQVFNEKDSEIIEYNSEESFNFFLLTTIRDRENIAVFSSNHIQYILFPKKFFFTILRTFWNIFINIFGNIF